MQLILFAFLFIGASGTAPSPLVLLNVIIDDLGYANVGWHNANPPENETPHLTQLAREGITLERCYAYMTCTPSRSSFMSGRLPVHVQTTLANPDVLTSGLPVNMTTFPSKLQRAGWTTAIGPSRILLRAQSGLSICAHAHLFHSSRRRILPPYSR